MKIISASHHHIPKGDFSTPYEFIEKIGRTCYKSENLITEGSAVKFVKGLCKSKHYAMLEHHWVHLQLKGQYGEFFEDLAEYSEKVLKSRGGVTDVDMHMEFTEGEHLYISAPLRVFLEMRDYAVESSEVPDGVVDMLETIGRVYNSLYDCLSVNKSGTISGKFTVFNEVDFIDELVKDDTLKDCSAEVVTNEVMKHKTHTVLFICDRGVTHELVRHRPCSFAQESTRYCNYSKGKFGEEITVIKPSLFKDWADLHQNYPSDEYYQWRLACERGEKSYFELLEMGVKPEWARSVLPTSLKAEIIMTTNEKEWQHIVDLRDTGITGAPHPQMREIMKPWHEELIMISGGRIK